ncbi:MAG TPA: glycosyltransferase family 2 protein [Labilithrix sp.]|nr:glycosyltransferase family 2 protein [Labilithrix sp.]
MGRDVGSAGRSKGRRKLVIQIPCHDEAGTLGATLAELPRAVDGFDVVELLVIDDGSTDETSDVARRAGVDHIVRHARREGLASAFSHGLDVALRAGADVIVNTDGDNQYAGASLPSLVAPILEGTADIVVGDRVPKTLAHFRPAKRLLSGVGSWAVSIAAGATIPDAASGFRAMSRAAALRLIVQSEFTYTHETLIQATRRRMAIAHVPVEVRETTRKSRLARSMFAYITRSAATIFRAYTMYQPLRVFTAIGLVLGLAGCAIGVRFLWFFFHDRGNGHVQSLLLCVLLVAMGFGCFLMGLLGDVIAGNRRLLEELVWRVRTLEVEARERAPQRSAPASPESS